MTFRRPRLSDVFAADLINRWMRFDPRSIRFDDRVKSWEEAQEKSTGYSDQEITERLLLACRAVRDGLAVAQRDGVLLDHLPVNWPLTACLLREMSSGVPLRVIDLGGDLGSTYHAVKSLLPEHVALEWLVVEQPSVVELGRSEFSGKNLRFSQFKDIELSDNSNTVLLVSNSLHYLLDPFTTVCSLIEKGVASVVLHGVPTVDISEEKIPTLQRVPTRLGRSSYPAWLFSASVFSTLSFDTLSVASTWLAPGAAVFTKQGKRITWRGAHLRMGDKFCK